MVNEHFGDAYNKVMAIIQSCTNGLQLIIAMRVANRYHIRYGYCDEIEYAIDLKQLSFLYDKGEINE